MTVASAAPLTPGEAREALAREWASFAPSTPDQVTEFYKQSTHLAADLDAFHSSPERQQWTDALIHVAQQAQATTIVDIGSGAGHDLMALWKAGSYNLHGVEPNDRLRGKCIEIATMHSDVSTAPIETADLISCFDVLEHVVNPEQFFDSIARRAKVNALLLETCATFDTGTPLHLKENRGWKPGHCLEAAGWMKRGQSDRMRVWQKASDGQTGVHTALLICAYRSVSLPTVSCVLNLLDDPANPYGWRVSLNGEAGINRSRSIMASRWYTETADDVFLMLDDDIIFSPEEAERLVTLCREGHDIICAGYPVRDGGHVALRGYGHAPFSFGPAEPPVEIRYASTGFLAVHRRVLDTLIPTLPLCHGNQPWAFWPLFDFKTIEDEAAGGHNYLSEDWNFCQMALDAGFKVWLDPSIRLKHLGLVPITVANMEAVHAVF